MTTIRAKVVYWTELGHAGILPIAPNGRLAAIASVEDTLSACEASPPRKEE
jgi:hypothetical protein